MMNLYPSGPSSVRSSVAQAASGTIITVQTAANGTSFATFGSQACTALDIINNTGFTLEIQRGGAGSVLTLLTGQARLMVGITNANQIGVRRSDQSTAQITVTAEAYTVA